MKAVDKVIVFLPNEKVEKFQKDKNWNGKLVTDIIIDEINRVVNVYLKNDGVHILVGHSFVAWIQGARISPPIDSTIFLTKDEDYDLR